MLCACAVTASAQNSQMVVLEYEDAWNSDSGMARILTDKLSKYAKNVIPRNRKSKNELTVSLELTPVSGPAAFGAYVHKNKEMRIQLPASYTMLSSDRETMRLIMSWMLLARAGYGSEHALAIRDSWFVSGLVRKALEDMKKKQQPAFRYYPAAYALASHGIVPHLRYIMDGKLSSFDGAPAAMQDEYCELLIDACAKNGLFREDIIEKSIVHMLEKSEKTPYEFFIETVGPSILKRGAGIFSSALSFDELDRQVPEWYTGEASKTLVSFFMPSSVQQIEKDYRKASEWTFESVKGVKQTIRIMDFQEKWDSIPNPSDAVTEIMEKLGAISFSAPPELREPMSEIRMALTALRTSRKKSDGERLKNAERNFFLSVEKRIALEYFLRESENRNVPPGTRFAETVRTSSRWADGAGEPVAGISALLDTHSK